MMTVNAVLELNGKEIVPVRAIPFVTGGDMSPKCLAGILADPASWLLASVLGPNNTETQMLPKNWKQYRDQLAVIASGINNLDLTNRTSLEILPPSTFVYWEALWRTHENYFLPSREEIYESPPEEQANYELQPDAIIPKELFELVFKGFQVPCLSNALTAVKSTSSLPSSVPALSPQSASASAQIVANTSAVKSAPLNKGFVYKKRVLLAKLLPIWPSIAQDFHHSNDNDLSVEAKATKHGDWHEESALNWARKNGKLRESAQTGATNSVFDLPGKIHTIKG